MSNVELVVEECCELREVLADLFAAKPLFEGTLDVLLAESERGQRGVSAGLLQTPGCRVAEVQLAVGRAASAMLLEHEPHVHVWVGVQLSLQGVQLVVGLVDLARIVIVLQSAAENLLVEVWLSSADHQVQNDLLLSEALVQTVLDARVNVDVPHGAAVHQHVALHDLRVESAGD